MTVNTFSYIFAPLSVLFLFQTDVGVYEHLKIITNN